MAVTGPICLPYTQDLPGKVADYRASVGVSLVDPDNVMHVFSLNPNDDFTISSVMAMRAESRLEWLREK
jgi:hypothetical protein